MVSTIPWTTKPTWSKRTKKIEVPLNDLELKKDWLIAHKLFPPYWSNLKKEYHQGQR